jgi:hypothetical protein
VYIQAAMVYAGYKQLHLRCFFVMQGVPFWRAGWNEDPAGSFGVHAEAQS